MTDGSGNDRAELMQALKLFEQAGWRVKDMKLVNPAGEQMRFTILLPDPSYERVALPYARDAQASRDRGAGAHRSTRRSTST